MAEENEALTPDEIITVLGITMTVSAGKNFMHFMRSLNFGQDETGVEDEHQECSPGCCD